MSSDTEEAIDSAVRKIVAQHKRITEATRQRTLESMARVREDSRRQAQLEIALRLEKAADECGAWYGAGYPRKELLAEASRIRATIEGEK